MNNMIKLNLLVIRCNDIEKSKGFYEGLGLEFVEEQHGAGPRHYTCEMNDMVFELYPLKPGEVIDDSRLGFDVADLEASTTHLEIEKRYLINSRQMYLVSDPDGRKVELWSP